MNYPWYPQKKNNICKIIMRIRLTRSFRSTCHQSTQAKNYSSLILLHDLLSNYQYIIKKKLLSTINARNYLEAYEQAEWHCAQNKYPRQHNKDATACGCLTVCILVSCNGKYRPCRYE